MRFRSLILMVLAVLCTSQAMAQSKRNVRKRPATNRTVVKKTRSLLPSQRRRLCLWILRP